MSNILVITIAYAVGLISVLRLDFGTAVIFSLCFVLVCMLQCIFCRRVSRRLAAGVALFCGVLMMSGAWYSNSGLLGSYIDRYIEIYGVVSDVTGNFDEYYSYELQADSLHYNGNDIALKEPLRVTSEYRFDVGNRLALRGFLSEISSPDNRTEFDYRLYYKSKGMIYRLHAEEAELVAERAFLLSPAYAGNYIKSRLEFAIDRFYSGDTAAFINAVLLGKKGDFSDSYRKILLQTSADRFLRPSYLHLFLLISLCEFAFAFFKRSKRQIALVVILAVYAMLNCGFNTFLKAALLFVFTMSYSKIRGFSHYPDMIAAAALVLLAANPLFITCSWFVMSVWTGCVLYLFCKPVSAYLKTAMPWLSTSTLSLISAWIVGTIGSMPVSAYFFSGCSMYSIIFSLFYIPLSLILLLFAPVSLLLYELLGRAGIIGAICRGTAAVMKTLPEIVALLPGHYISLKRPGVLGFSVIICLFALCRLLLYKRYYEGKFKAVTALTALLFSVYCVITFADIGNLYLYFVNVGQGDGAVIDIRGKSTVLIDGGGRSGESTYNAGERVYLPYLAANGFGRIDLAIVSHYHSDHADGIISAIENFRVNTVMLPDVMENSVIREQIIRSAEENGTSVLFVSAGDRLDFTSGLVIDVLSPAAGMEYSDENDTSLALRLEYKGTSMFFGGDITSDTEKYLLGKLGQIDILKVSHHGSKSSSSEAFISETAPEYAVFSVGENNMYGHPSENVQKSFEAAGSQILRTDTMGDIIIRSNKNGLTVDTFKEGS